MAISEKINLNGGKQLGGRENSHHYLQAIHPWLPKLPTKKEFTSPWGERPSFFNYDCKLKDLMGQMIPYVAVSKMIKTGMFNTHDSEYCQTFYTDLVSDTYIKVHKSIHNWNLRYDFLRYIQLMVNFSWLSTWTLMKQEKKIIKGILDPQLHLSYQESLELFMSYTDNNEDELCAKLIAAGMEKEDEFEGLVE